MSGQFLGRRIGRAQWLKRCVGERRGGRDARCGQPNGTGELEGREPTAGQEPRAESRSRG
jgi:hypothetical protein